jgi:hypothetical protein
MGDLVSVIRGDFLEVNLTDVVALKFKDQYDTHMIYLYRLPDRPRQRFL